VSAHGPKTHAPADPEALRARIRQAYDQPSRALAEEKLILDHLPMVRHIVQKVAAHLPPSTDTEDLISAGTLGLVHAAKQFDASRRTEFSTYAYIRIRGAVIDELRQRSFVSPGVHQRVRAIQKAWRECLGPDGRPPDDEELARAAGLSLEQLYRTLEEARNQHFLSIHGLTEDAPALPAFLPPDQGPTPDQQLQRKELIEALARAIRELPEKERKTILLYYERDLNMKETAEVLHVTESRVSQLHASALFKLSMKLGSLT